MAGIETINILYEGALSAAPATQNEANMIQKRSQKDPNVAPSTQNDADVLKVLHLPRKSSRRP